MINNHKRFLSDTANPKITIIIIKSFMPKENKEKVISCLSKVLTKIWLTGISQCWKICSTLNLRCWKIIGLNL